MYFEVRDYVTQIGEGICNEDVAGVRDGLAWIMDGATDVNASSFFGNVTDAKWLTDRLDTWLRYQDFAFSSTDLPKEFGRLAEHVNAGLVDVDFPADRLPPACSCGLARIDEERGTIELALVGDVYLFSVAHGEMLSNAFFAKREAAGVRQARMRQGESNLVLRDREQIAARRRGYIRGANGQFVLSSNPGVVHGVLTKSVPVRPGDMILLCTDGFARLVEGYRIHESWADLADAAIHHGLTPLLQQLREYEAGHGHSAHNYKASDDACAILVSVEGN